MDDKKNVSAEELKEGKDPEDTGKSTGKVEETVEDSQGTGPEGPDYDVIVQLKEEKQQLFEVNEILVKQVEGLETEVENLASELQGKEHAVKSLVGKLKKAGVKDKIIRHS